MDILNPTKAEKDDTHTALPGPSLANVAPVPRKIERKPPSLYSLDITSIGPE